MRVTRSTRPSGAHRRGYQEDGRDSVGGQTVVRLSASKDGKTYWVTVGITSQAAAGGTSVFYHIST